MSTKAEFRDAVVQAKTLAHGDSNDREIEALQEIVSIGCALLGLDEQALDDEAYEAAEKAGLC